MKAQPWDLITVVLTSYKVKVEHFVGNKNFLVPRGQLCILSDDFNTLDSQSWTKSV